MTECWKTIGVFGDSSCPELAKHIHCRNCPVFVSAGRQLMDRPPPPGYREEWTALLARDKATRSFDLSALVFRVANEWLALDTSLFVEVARWRAPHRIPHRRGSIAGLVNIRGQLQLCVDLRTLLRLGAPAAASATARILVIARGGVTWAVIGDEVHGVEQIARDAIRPPPITISDGGHLRGVTRWDGRDVGVLDGDVLFEALAKVVGGPREEAR